MSDVRKQERLRQNLDLVWAVKAKGLSGRGSLINVSLGGACIELNQSVALERGSAVSLMCSRIPALPASGKVLWTKSSSSGAPSTVCGVGFEPQGTRWAAWIAAQQPALTR